MDAHRGERMVVASGPKPVGPAEGGGMTVAGTVADLVGCGAADAPAIGAPGRASLTFEALRGLVTQTGAALNAAGIGRGDCVAIVLPNGPEAATAFLAVACHAATAPLNPT